MIKLLLYSIVFDVFFHKNVSTSILDLSINGKLKLARNIIYDFLHSQEDGIRTAGINVARSKLKTI